MNRPHSMEQRLLHANNANHDYWQSRNTLVSFPDEASQKNQGISVSHQNFPGQINPHHSAQFLPGLPTIVPSSGNAISQSDNSKNFPKHVYSSQHSHASSFNQGLTNTSFSIPPPPPLPPLCQQFNTPRPPLSAHNLGKASVSNLLPSPQDEQRTQLNNVLPSNRTANQIGMLSRMVSARVSPVQSHSVPQSSTTATAGQQSANFVATAQPFSSSVLPQTNCIISNNFPTHSISPSPINNSSTRPPFLNQGSPQTGSLSFVHSSPAPPLLHSASGPLQSVPPPLLLHSAQAPRPLHSAPAPPPLHSAPAPSPLHSAPAPPPLHSAPAPPPLHSAPAPPPLHSAPAPPPLHSAPAPPPLHSAPAPPPLHNSLHHANPFTLPVLPQVNPAVITHPVNPKNYLPFPMNNSSVPQTPSFNPQTSSLSESAQRVLPPVATYFHTPQSSHIPVSVAFSAPSVMYNESCVQTFHPHQIQSGNQPTGLVDNQQVVDELFVKDLLKRKRKPSAIRKQLTTTTLTIPEFRCMIKQAYTILNELSEAAANLTSLQSKEAVFKFKISSALKLKDKLANLCSKILDPEVVRYMQQKLRKVRKKRDYRRKQKEQCSQYRREMEQNRAELHQKIDSWLEELKEKDLQQKRESEMKKEADNILAEVRKKIYEAKRTLEKLKILEKLRQARKDNAQQKGLFVSSKSDERFIEKVLILKKVMDRQLNDYEAEEKALSVMLETEQEGQREEEAAHRLKKLNQCLEKKQRDIEQCLFGKTDVPSASDPMFFFWQHYNRGKSSTDNLLQIRHEWDVQLVPSSDENGSNIPQQWVTPDTPCDKVWASAL